MTYKNKKMALAAATSALLFSVGLALLLSQIIFERSIFGLGNKQILHVLVSVSCYCLAYFADGFWRVQINQSRGLVRKAILYLGLVASPLFAYSLVFPGLQSTLYSAVFLLLGAIPFALASARPLPMLVTSIPFAVFAIVLQNYDRAPNQYLTGIFQPAQETDLTPYFDYNLDTTLYEAKLRIYEDVLECHESSKSAGDCRAPRNGGGVELYADGYLVSTGAGKLHYLTFGGAAGVDVSVLATEVPINAEAFIADGHADKVWLFRVTDILLVEAENEKQMLYAAHHIWNEESDCVALQISRTEGGSSSLFSGSALEWETVYTTEPCLKLQEEWSRPFRGDESGGKMALFEGRIFLTVGDYGMMDMAQEPATDYGKIISLGIDGSDRTLVSLGHRNPQGLWIDVDGQIWSTEHGPKGGDELNLITSGLNYGWPIVTYGTAYGAFLWERNPQQGRHEGYTKPVFSWVRSTAASSLIRLSGDGFPNWHNDFLVASYKKTLWRVRVQGGRAEFAEPIMLPSQINGRVRDMIQSEGGEIFFTMDDGSVGLISNGETGLENTNVSLAQCKTCHSLQSDGPRQIGPHLAGLGGRQIASVSDYGYSSALSGLGGSWTSQNLDLFLKDPQKFAPGTTMNFVGIRDDAERAELIRALFEQTER